MSEQDIIRQFLDAMAAAGLKTDASITADGELHRVHVEGDPRNTKHGWYVLHPDGIPAGEFGCWKRGVQKTWCAKSDREMSAKERAEVRQRIDAARAEREERTRQQHQSVAQEARRIWDDAREVEGDGHEYLKRKGVQSYGLRLGTWPTGAPALLVPICAADGQLMSLQAIFANKNPTIGRDKDFLAGGKKRGCFATIGAPPPGGAGVVVIVEGYATGASIHQATGYFVVVAFDAYNLKPVCHEIRRRYPAATILVAADNDRWTLTPVENPGVTEAKKCADIAHVLMVAPEFADLAGEPTDFNDLAAREGLDAVREQITAALPAAPDADNDNAPDIVPLDANVSPFGFPHVSDKGQPLNTPENLAYLLTTYGIGCRYNVISKDVEIDIPDRTFSQDNGVACNMATITGLCARNRMPRENLGDYLQLIADHNQRNPAAEWIESKAWDGQDRIPALARTLDPVDLELATLLLRRWLIGAAAAVYEPAGVALQGVLVLQGAQYAGKTTWILKLAEFNHQLVKEAAMLNPADRDSVKQVISYWLVELGELDATFRKSDISALKGFITRSQDELFLRYSRAISSFPRRTAFAASVNEKAYLRDDTGNRRYWTIQCGAGLSALHDVDMQQVWAQVRTLHQGGEQFRLTRAEMDRLNAANESHQEVSPVEELVLSRFDWAGDRVHPMTATDVLLAIGYDRPNTKQVREAGMVLRKVCGEEPKKSGSRRLFNMPRQFGRRYAGMDEPAL